VNLSARLARNRKPIVADGAIGTELIAVSRAEGFPHPRPIDRSNVDQPELVREMHRVYLAAGAALLTTNTFCANGHYLPADEVVAVNSQAVELAREAIAAQERSGDVLVFGSSGPVPPSADCQSIYQQQFRALTAAGVDAIYLETVRFLGTAQAALAAHAEVRMIDSQTPGLVVSYSPVDDRLALEDASLEEFVYWVTAQPIVGLGVNCGDGGTWLQCCLAEMRMRFSGPLLAMPSAGLPSASGRYPLSPERWASQLTGWQREFDLAIVGGCCGAGPGHIRQLVTAIDNQE